MAKITEQPTTNTGWEPLSVRLKTGAATVEIRVENSQKAKK